MGGFTVKIDDRGAARKLNALRKLTGNAQPMFAAVGRVLVNRIRLCFKLGVNPWGNPWLALKFRQGQPLRDSGRLQRSITARPDASGVTVGTNVEHARVHQFGAVIEPVKAKRLVFPGPNGALIFAKRVTVPARAFLPIRRDGGAIALPPSWSVDAARAIKAYFAQAIAKA